MIVNISWEILRQGHDGLAIHGVQCAFQFASA
jgi:hypothetical protein